MSDINNLLNKLDGDFRFDTGQVLLHLLQYSIRNRKYLEVILRNQLEIKHNLTAENTDSVDSENQLEDLLEDLQKDIEKEYFDLLSFISSNSNP